MILDKSKRDTKAERGIVNWKLKTKPLEDLYEKKQ